MSKRKVYRAHFVDAVYIGPTEPHTYVPPHQEVSTMGRASEWDVYEDESGDVFVTHTNPRWRDKDHPHGLRCTTRVPAANIRDVQYVFEALPAAGTQPQLAKVGGK